MENKDIQILGDYCISSQMEFSLVKMMRALIANPEYRIQDPIRGRHLARVLRRKKKLDPTLELEIRGFITSAGLPTTFFISRGGMGIAMPIEKK
jgi:hypothetical protein